MVVAFDSNQQLDLPPKLMAGRKSVTKWREEKYYEMAGSRHFLPSVSDHTLFIELAMAPNKVKDNQLRVPKH